MDDSAAREDWGWDPKFGLAEMTTDMLEVLGAKHERGEL
jgi:nucleoside-diphosphate-sugar epimerase